MYNFVILRAKEIIHGEDQQSAQWWIAQVSNSETERLESELFNWTFPKNSFISMRISFI